MLLKTADLENKNYLDSIFIGRAVYFAGFNILQKMLNKIWTPRHHSSISYQKVHLFYRTPFTSCFRVGKAVTTSKDQKISASFLIKMNHIKHWHEFCCKYKQQCINHTMKTNVSCLYYSHTTYKKEKFLSYQHLTWLYLFPQVIIEVTYYLTCNFENIALSVLLLFLERAFLDLKASF